MMDPDVLLQRMVRAESDLAKSDGGAADAMHNASNELRKLLAFQIRYAELAAREATAKRMKNAQKNNEEARKVGERVATKVAHILKSWPILAEAGGKPSHARPQTLAAPVVQVAASSPQDGDDEHRLDEVVVEQPPRSPSPLLVAAPGFEASALPPKTDSQTSLEIELNEDADDGEPTPGDLLASLSPDIVEALARSESSDEGDVEMGGGSGGSGGSDDDETDAGDGEGGGGGDDNELAAETDAGGGEVDGGDIPLPDDKSGQMTRGGRVKRLTPAALHEAAKKALPGVRAKAAALLSLDAGAACFTSAVTEELCTFIKAGLGRVEWHSDREVLTLLYDDGTRALTTLRAPPSAEEVDAHAGRLVMLLNTFHSKSGVPQHTLGLSRIMYTTSVTYAESPPPFIYNQCINPVPTTHRCACAIGRVFPALFKSQIMHARPTAAVSNLVMDRGGDGAGDGAAGGARKGSAAGATPAPPPHTQAAPLLGAAARGAPFLLEPDYAWLEVADCSVFAEPIVDTYTPSALTMALRAQSLLVSLLVLVEYLILCWPVCALRMALQRCCCRSPPRAASPVEVHLGRMVTNARWQAFFIGRKASLLGKIDAAKRDEWPCLINAAVNNVRKAHADAFYRAGKARSLSILPGSVDLGISGFSKATLNLRRELLCTSVHAETAYWFMVKVYVLALMVAKDKRGDMGKALKSARRRKKARVAIETIDKVAKVARFGMGQGQ